MIENFKLKVFRGSEEAEIVSGGLGKPAWEEAGKLGKNSQRVISIKRLRAIAARHESGTDAALLGLQVSVDKDGAVTSEPTIGAGYIDCP